jgi:hypothetical protein
MFTDKYNLIMGSIYVISIFYDGLELGFLTGVGSMDPQGVRREGLGGSRSKIKPIPLLQLFGGPQVVIDT